MNSSLVMNRRKILRAIAEHLDENDCRHSLSEILSSQMNDDTREGWRASQADPTTGFTDSSAVNSQEDDTPTP